MNLSIEYVSNHLFVNHLSGRLHSNNYFRCYHSTCPFSLLMEVNIVSGKKVAVSCLDVIVPVHLHHTGNSRISNRATVLSQLEFTRAHPSDPKTVSFQKQHSHWEREARKHSKKYKRHLIEIEAVKIYALNHQEKSAKQIKEDCCLSLNPRSICNIIRREKKIRGITVNFNEMIQQKSHHILGCDGNEIVVFGLSSSIHFLSKTT